MIINQYTYIINMKINAKYSKIDKLHKNVILLYVLINYLLIMLYEHFIISCILKLS